MRAAGHLALLALGLMGPAALPAAHAGSTTSALDAGGRRTSSASYVVDGSLGGMGGIATAGAPQVTARHGYAGQLYDVQSLALSASPATINEAGTRQLGAAALLDDATLLPLAATGVAWSVAGGPLASVSAGGLATASNVYQNTAATVRADYAAKFGTLPLTVLNTGNDDFGLYAGDGMNDAWQVGYFGLNNANAGPALDPDGDGVPNLQEYTADTNPTNALSLFRIQSTARAAGFRVYFQSSSNRTYTLYATTNLPSAIWTNVPSQTDIAGSGGVDVLTNAASAERFQFYRVGVRVP